MADSSPKKEKKEKKDKKDKKDKKYKKDKKAKRKTLDLGESVDKYSDEFLDNERFRPVPNPAFNPALTSPLTSPNPSIHSINSNKTDEKWLISSKRKGEDVPALQTHQQPNIESSSPLTPAELQGFAAQKYVPSGSYTHLDPTKHENAHFAFDQLKKVIKETEQPQQSQPTPSHITTVQQKVVSQAKSTPPPKNLSRRPSRLGDGAPVLKYVRALWNYTAQIPSELSFSANDKFAIINEQPDGWWYAEFLDKKKRGLVPGNYMTPN